MNGISKAVKDYMLPIALAIVPFIPTIYDSITEPDHYYIYESTYKKNPVSEWNRQLDDTIKQIESHTQENDIEPPAPLLRKIGKEIYQSLPAMLAGSGFKPMDKKTVEIVNISKYDLKNIKVHFIGCTGFNSFETYPDAYGSLQNTQLAPKNTNSTVTIKYDSIPKTIGINYKVAIITYYGADASSCKPTVEAELLKGGTAAGKEVDITSYTLDELDKSNRISRIQDTTFKIILSIIALYFYFQIRALKRLTKEQKQ